MNNYFAWIGRLEGVSLLLLLFLAMPVKYLAGEPILVRWIGMAHGLLFLLYVAVAFAMYAEHSWKKRVLLACLVLSSVPFGTFFFERKLQPKAV